MKSLIILSILIFSFTSNAESTQNGAEKLLNAVREQGEIQLNGSNCEITIKYHKTGAREVFYASVHDNTKHEGEFVVLNGNDPYENIKIRKNTIKMVDQQTANARKSLTIKTDENGEVSGASVTAYGFTGLLNIPSFVSADCNLNN